MEEASTMARGRGARARGRREQALQMPCRPALHGKVFSFLPIVEQVLSLDPPQDIRTRWRGCPASPAGGWPGRHLIWISDRLLTKTLIHVPDLSGWTGDICIAKIARYVEVDKKERCVCSGGAAAICMCVICLYSAI